LVAAQRSCRGKKEKKGPVIDPGERRREKKTKLLPSPAKEEASRPMELPGGARALKRVKRRTEKEHGKGKNTP